MMYRPVASGVQVGAIHPQQIWILLLRSCKLLKINMLIVLLENVQQPFSSMCCGFWTAIVGYNTLSKIYVYI